MKKEKIKITCYGETEIWEDRAKAMAFYFGGMCECDGSERERYTNIYCQLMEGKTEISDEEEGEAGND